MKSTLIAAAVAAFAALPAFADGPGTHRHAGSGELPRFQGGQIVVSCFRGPWQDVIWDRPNSVFVESLVAIGYDYPTAHAVAERVCRDDRLVGNPDGLRRTMLEIYYDARSRTPLPH